MIVVQAEETLGHYAEWLDLRASRLRQINDMRFGTPVLVGRKIKLEFTRINKEDFEQRRVNFQKQYQEQYFLDHRIDSIYKHSIKRGESLWHLAAKKFKVPMWLLRQHNPDVNFSRIKPGMTITVPVIKQTL
jgi:membrane-bound lytic murein transglycosylase D